VNPSSRTLFPFIESRSWGLEQAACRVLVRLNFVSVSIVRGRRTVRKRGTAVAGSTRLAVHLLSSIARYQRRPPLVSISNVSWLVDYTITPLRKCRSLAFSRSGRMRADHNLPVLGVFEVQTVSACCLPCGACLRRSCQTASIAGHIAGPCHTQRQPPVAVKGQYWRTCHLSVPADGAALRWSLNRYQSVYRRDEPFFCA